MMYPQGKYSALHMDSNLSDLSQQTLRGRVYGIYHKCFSVLLQDGRLISIFGRMPYQLPMAIMTELPEDRPFADAELSSGWFAVFDAGEMYIDEAGLRLDLRRARLRNTTRSKMTLINPAALNDAAGVMAVALDSTGKSLGEGRRIGEWSAFLMEGRPLRCNSAILPRMAALLEHILRGDAEKTEAALMNLVGLGIGLTPSADDMLCGLAHSVYMLGNDERGELFLRTLSRFLDKYGEERTTLVSLQQLKQSTCGIMSDQIFLLLEAIHDGKDPDELRTAIRRVVDYGSSSGTELCMGALAGCAVIYNFTKYR